MRAPTRAREISFTFTPCRVYRPLRSGDGGADSEVPRRLCMCQAFALRRFLRAVAVTAGQQSLTLVSEPLPLAPVASRAPSLPPTALPLVVPHCRGGAEQKTRCSLCTCGVQWGKGAFCAHRDDEGLKWTAVVQVGFH